MHFLINVLDDAIVRIKLVTVQKREAELTAGKAEEVKARRRKRGIYGRSYFGAFHSYDFACAVFNLGLELRGENRSCLVAEPCSNRLRSVELQASKRGT